MGGALIFGTAQEISAIIYELFYFSLQLYETDAIIIIPIFLIRKLSNRKFKEFA